MIQSENGHKRAVLYARVSTDEQAKNYSTDSQLDEIRKYAERHGLRVVAQFADDFTGAMPIEQRPEGRKAYAMLASGEADALIVYTMDRLVRPPDDGDEWDTPVLIRGLARLGREIHTCNRGKLSTSFADLLIAMLDAKSAGDERRKIVERTSRGRNAKARKGLVVGAGGVPYGYCYQDGAFEIEEAEARIVRHIFEWYTGSDGKPPLGIMPISHRLQEMGLRPPRSRALHSGDSAATEAQREATRESEVVLSVWRPSTLYRILTNETYAGVWHYGKAIGKNGNEGRRNKNEQIAVEVKPIISRELWEAAQAQRAHNAKMSQRNATPRRYLLRGMVKCGVCGRSMFGKVRTSNGKQYTYYSCRWSGTDFPTADGVLCDNTSARSEPVEVIAWKYALEIITDRDKLESRLRQAQAQQLAALQPKRAELATVEAFIKEAEAELDDIAQALKRARGRVTDKLERDQDAANENYDTLCQKRDKLQAEIEAGAITDESITNTLRFSEDVELGLNNPTFDDKRRWLEYLNTEVEVTRGEVTVACIPFGDPRSFGILTS